MYMKYMFVCVYIYIYIYIYTQKKIILCRKHINMMKRLIEKKLNPQFVKIYVQFTGTILCQTHQKIQILVSIYNFSHLKHHLSRYNNP